ncbi:nuclear transport factor 2 family protein [Nonomuraea terrae]|uniref:Nuclear transport factor 2 family protein n=1 Tax=Nonomuraea terrae TaxID=2530383 RepID=A0A4R4YQ29_9ACTN|nr:nuclear transport factor 2 family protein [Nonomuraea terrae]TDD47241.1 nuclear transport factor 2 family protein [Nonomuraea terrae]
METLLNGVAETERRTRALIGAFERKDLAVVSALLADDSTLTLPLSFSGRTEDAARFTGREEVLGYARNAFTITGRIRFANVRISVADGGRTSFVRADGDFTTADGRPYRNVYVYSFEWRGGRTVDGAEYGNPVTFSATFAPSESG